MGILTRKFGLSRAVFSSSALLVSAGCSVGIGLDGSDVEANFDSGETEGALSGQSWKFWRTPAGTNVTNISVCFEPAGALTEADKDAVFTYATQSWASVSRVNFKYWGDCTYTCDPRATGVGACTSDQGGIHVTKRERCRSTAIGSAINGVRNGLWVTGSPPDKYCVVHEFGHALGMTHEQERTDNHVCNEDQTQSEPDVGITPYDNNSVMSYCGPNDGNLTDYDILGIKAIYGGSSVMPLPYSDFAYKQFGQTRYALRAASGDFMRINVATNDIIGDQNGIATAEELFYIDRVKSLDDYLSYGDTVSFTSKGLKRLLALDGANNWEVVAAAATPLTAAEIWTVVNVRHPTSTARVQVNDEVAFRSTYGRYLYRGTDQNIRAHNTSIQSLEIWRIMWLPFGESV